MREIIVREDKISFLRRLFGVSCFLIALFMLSFGLDSSLCLLSGAFEKSCHQMNIDHPNFDLIKKSLTERPTLLLKGPLGIGLLFFFIFSFTGTFFGFFHGKQVFFKGQLILKNYLFGFCIRTKVLATLSQYKEINVTKEVGSMIKAHGSEKEVITFPVRLVGESGPQIVGVFLKYEDAFNYGEALAKASHIPLKNEAS